MYRAHLVSVDLGVELRCSRTVCSCRSSDLEGLQCELSCNQEPPSYFPAEGSLLYRVDWDRYGHKLEQCTLHVRDMHGTLVSAFSGDKVRQDMLTAECGGIVLRST